MLEQAAVALPCVAQFTASGTGATGLTVTCTVYKWGGSSWSTVVTSQSATEVGEGFYSYQLASGSNTGEGLYLFVFSTAGTADLKKIGVGWAVNKAGVEFLTADLATLAASLATLTTYVDTEIAAIKAKTDLIVAGTPITINSTVAADASLPLVPGTAYTGVRQAKPSFEIDPADWDLTSATVTLVIVSGDISILSVAGTVTAPGATGQAVAFSLTATNTALLTRIGLQAYTYQVNAVWAVDSPAAPVRLAHGDVHTSSKYL